MINEIKLLTKIQICNFFGLNEAKYSRDSKKKNRKYTAIIGLLIFAVMIGSQVGSTTYTLLMFDAPELIPSMTGAIISGLTFALTLFRAGPSLFSIESFEKTICLPVKTESIVISRFLNMYIYNMIFNIVISLTTVGVCAYCGYGSILFYPTMLLGSLILPIVPMIYAVIIGTVGYYFTSRAKHKNALNIIWYLAVFAVIFLLPTNTAEMPGEEVVGQITSQMASVEKIFIGLQWFTNGVNSSVLQFLLFITISLAFTFASLYLVSKFYKQICIRLSATAASRNYTITKQTSRVIGKTLYIREIKRYFSSVMYVMNTIIGYIFAVALGIYILVFGMDSICKELGLPVEILIKALPIVIGIICNMTPTTAASISMEGKNFWLLKALPIGIKEIANAKLAVNLTFAVPACLISSTCIAITLKTNIFDMIFIFAIPLILVVFGSCVGLYINILNPMMDWESEAIPVKQSKSTLLTMITLFLFEVAALIAHFAVSSNLTVIINIIITIVFLIGSAFVYSRILKTDIKNIA